MKKAVIFTRVSSKEQEEGASIEAQLDTLRKYATKKALNVVKEYEITESSTKGERKEFNEMLDFALSQKEKPIAILVNTVDRLQRSFKETVLLKEPIQKGDIELHFIRENKIIDKESTANDFMIWNFQTMISESYVAQLSENVKRSGKYLREQGVWLSKAPIGYLNKRDDNNKAIVVIDENKAFIIRKLFEEYSKGLYSLEELKPITKELGLKTSNNKDISKSQLHTMIKNPFYYGVMKVKGELYSHIHGAIISKALFDKCQQVLDKQGTYKGKIDNKKVKEEFSPFKGLVRCSCGCLLTPIKKVKPSGKTYIYLTCSHAKGNCIQKPIREEVFLEQINDLFKSFQMPQDVLDGIIESLNQFQNKQEEFSKQAINTLSKEYHSIDGKISKLLDAFSETNSITTDMLDKRILALNTRKNEIEDRIQDYTSADDESKKTLEGLVLLMSKAYSLFNSSEVPKKRAIINYLLWNLHLEHGSLCFSIKKPFNELKDYESFSNGREDRI
ncbi:MAG: recombinase family protein [Alphaproteobacteria bacterium]|nr:recombinase family protein [Alphaproteobacteria bacterium]